MADDELKRLLQENAAEIQRHFDETANRLVSENRRHFDETADRLASENRHHFDVAMESNRHEIGLIAEKVTRLDEKLEKTSANLAQRIEQTAAETQAMIKFSHAELDRRLRTVEESVSDLQARVERIESSTH